MLTTDTVIVKQQIKRHQTVLDFTCQFAGTMEALFDVLAMNNISMTEDPDPATDLLVPQEELKTISFYTNKELDIVTDNRIQPVPGGIGFMQIGTSFKVS